MHSTPTNSPIPCWACRYFAGMTAQGSAALCNLPGASRVRASPAGGCVCWVREPGADDEPGPPGVVPAVEAWQPWDQRAQPLPVPRVPVKWAP